VSELAFTDCSVERIAIDRVEHVAGIGKQRIELGAIGAGFPKHRAGGLERALCGLVESVADRDARALTNGVDLVRQRSGEGVLKILRPDALGEKLPPASIASLSLIWPAKAASPARMLGSIFRTASI
jgi:hypothetical protein